MLSDAVRKPVLSCTECRSFRSLELVLKGGMMTSVFYVWKSWYCFSTESAWHWGHWQIYGLRLVWSSVCCALVVSWYMPCCLLICRCVIVVLVANSYSLCAFTFYSNICLSSCHLLTAAASRLACIEAQVCSRNCSVTKTYCFTLLSHSRCCRLSRCQMLYHYNVKCI